jgi:hypothetical protein
VQNNKIFKMLFDISLRNQCQNRRRKQKLKNQNTQRAFIKGLEGKKNARGQWVGHPWSKTSTV